MNRKRQVFYFQQATARGHFPHHYILARSQTKVNFLLKHEPLLLLHLLSLRTKCAEMEMSVPPDPVVSRCSKY